MPRDSSGKPAYNLSDPERPFVVGGKDSLSLGGKPVLPGPRSGTPTLYAVEDAALAVENLGDTEVSLGFQLVLCDRARLRVSQSTLRLADDVLASGQSVVELAGAKLSAGDDVRLVLDQDARASLSGSTVSTSIVPRRRAQVSVVNGLLSDLILEPCADVSLRLVQGSAPEVHGLTSGSVAFQDAALTRLHLVPGAGTNVRLLEGSALAGCVSPPGGSITATGTTLVGGKALVPPGARLHLVKSSLQEPLENLGPFLCQSCDLRSALTTRSSVWLADTRLGNITKDARWQGSQFYEVSLASPEDGAHVSGEVVVKGTLTANGVMTEKLIPFPPARLDLVRLETGERRVLATFDNIRHSEELARFDAADLLPGAYELRLHFDSELGAQAPSVRKVVVERKPKACGCSQPGELFVTLALLLSPGLLRRRRRATP